MAVGVPVTGMGGIFYILLSIVIIIHKAVKKILYFFGRRITESKDKLGLLKFPTMAFILCVGLLSYMNLSGFRFVLPGNQQTTVSISNLWLVGLFAFSLFIFFIVLVQIRSEQIEKPIENKQFMQLKPLAEIKATVEEYRASDIKVVSEPALPLDPQKSSCKSGFPQKLKPLVQVQTPEIEKEKHSKLAYNHVDPTILNPAVPEDKQSSLNPQQCPHFSEYVKSLPKGTPIPDECLGCQLLVECLLGRRIREEVFA